MAAGFLSMQYRYNLFILAISPSHHITVIPKNAGQRPAKDTNNHFHKALASLLLTRGRGIWVDVDRVRTFTLCTQGNACGEKLSKVATYEATARWACQGACRVSAAG